MVDKLKFICSGYNCNSQAKYIRRIDGYKLYFCETHKYCLDHSRSEMIYSMISSSRMSIPDLVNRFDFKKAGFPEDILRETIRVLLKGRHICLKKDVLYPRKGHRVCAFPSCQYMRTKNTYCSLHSDLPGESIIDDCLKSATGSLKTADQIAKDVSITTQESKSLLTKLHNAGVVEAVKVGRTYYYSTI